MKDLMDGTAQHAADPLQGNGLDLLEDLIEERGGEFNCFQLSSAQERLWFLNQMMPGSGVYNIAGEVRLTGELNRSALERSVQEIIRRHEILRTSFIQVAGKPLQQISEEVIFELREEDLRGVDSETVQRAVREEAERGFALDKPELLRVRLLRLGEQEYALTLVMHHIISDGWSLGVMLREMKSLYEAFEHDRPSPLLDLEIQYVDYAAWERESLASGDMQESLEFWEKELAEALPVLELPVDSPRPAEPSYRGGAIRFALTNDCTEKLKSFARKTGTTSYMVLLAGFKALLARYTGQSDILVGSPVAERLSVETESLIGLFVNLVVRRTTVHAGETFLALLQRVKQNVIQAQAHQHVPFGSIVDLIGQERMLSHMPMVQAVFAWQNGLFQPVQLGGLAGRARQIETGTAKFDITLSMDDAGGQFEGWLEYSADLFRRHTAAKMADRFVRLLEEAVAAPNKPLAELPLLSEAEQQQLAQWNRTATAYPREQTIARLFEEVALRRDGETALLYCDEQLSYADLNARSNQLARQLRQMGVGPEVTVGICAERSLEMVLGILGILKAGGAYVPLEASYLRSGCASSQGIHAFVWC